MNDATGFGPTSKRDTFVYWAKKLLVCNPFYLASAALLLFGLARISTGQHFLQEEISLLTFNFMSLQFYELLLVVTALLLARRLIWYDAKLLVALENLLVLGPFMLISQAALIDPQLIWMFCAGAAFFVVARCGLAQRAVPGFRFPPALAWAGLAVLLVNAAWPLVYRILHESKVGTKLDAGPAFEVHQLSWWLVIPMLIFAANLLPRPQREVASGRSHWVPLGFLSLWLAGTVTHLYSLGYVYDFDLRREWIAPAVWVLAWTVHLRLPVYFTNLSPALRAVTFTLPLPATLLAASATGSHVVLALNALNLMAFATTIWKEKENRFARHLALVTFALMVAAMPESLGRYLLGHFRRSDAIAFAAFAYGAIVCALSRNPKAAFGGGIAVAFIAGGLGNVHGTIEHWAVQAGLAYCLVHSLRWHDYEHHGATFTRWLLAAGWLAHTVLWVRTAGVVWNPMILAGIVAAMCGLRAYLLLYGMPRVVPVATLLVALCGPVNLLATMLQDIPTGFLAMAASLVCFAAGTALALFKARWRPTRNSDASV